MALQTLARIWLRGHEAKVCDFVSLFYLGPFGESYVQGIEQSQRGKNHVFAL